MSVPSPRKTDRSSAVPMFKPHKATEPNAMAPFTSILSPTPTPDLTDVQTRKRKHSDASAGLAASTPHPTSPVEAHPATHLPRPENPKPPPVPAKRFKKKPPDPFIPVAPRVSQRLSNDDLPLIMFSPSFSSVLHLHLAQESQTSDIHRLDLKGGRTD